MYTCFGLFYIWFLFLIKKCQDPIHQSPYRLRSQNFVNFNRLNTYSAETPTGTPKSFAEYGLDSDHSASPPASRAQADFRPALPQSVPATPRLAQPPPAPRPLTVVSFLHGLLAAIYLWAASLVYADVWIISSFGRVMKSRETWMLLFGLAMLRIAVIPHETDCSSVSFNEVSSLTLCAIVLFLCLCRPLDHAFRSRS